MYIFLGNCGVWDHRRWSEIVRMLVAGGGKREYFPPLQIFRVKSLLFSFHIYSIWKAYFMESISFDFFNRIAFFRVFQLNQLSLPGIFSLLVCWVECIASSDSQSHSSSYSQSSSCLLLMQLYLHSLFIESILLSFYMAALLIRLFFFFPFRPNPTNRFSSHPIRESRQ